MIIPEDTSGLFDGENGSWNSDTNRLLKAVDEENLDALQALLLKGVLVNAHGGVFHETPLHKAAQQGWAEGLKVLLSNGATANSVNQFGQTPLHYASASKSCECIKRLLDSGLCQEILDHKDNRGHAPLHDSSAAGHREGVALLLKAGATVNVRDKNDETPLHKAARSRSVPTMLALLNHGADLGARDQTGESVLHYVLRHIPGGMETLLDYCLTPNADKLTSKKLEVGFNFVPLAGNSELSQMRILMDVVDFGHPKLLLHPVCEAYLLLKWQYVRKLFFIEVIFYFVHSILSTLFILDKFVWHCWASSTESKNSTNLKFFTNVTNFTNLPNSVNFTNSMSFRNSMNVTNFTNFTNATNITDSMFVTNFMNISNSMSVMNSTNTENSTCGNKHVVFTLLITIVYFCVIVILLKQVLTIIQGVRAWLFSVWHVLNGVIPVLILIVIPGSISKWQQHLAAVTLLVMWVQCMFHVGRFPGCGIYVAMFTRVAKVFVRMILIFFCLLLAFALSFYVSYTNFNDAVFGNPLITFIKTLTMMIGELDFDDAFVEHLSFLMVTSHLIYLSFVILVSIILSNLLVALAVNDVQGLRNSAHLERLIKQLELVDQMERTFCSLKNMAHVTKFYWFEDKLKIFIQDYSFTKVFIQPFHPQKSNKLLVLEHGILKEINLRQNHVTIIMECLRLREAEKAPTSKTPPNRRSRRQLRSEYSEFSCGPEEIGVLLKKVEGNLLEAINEKMEDNRELLSSLSMRVRALEEALMCGVRKDEEAGSGRAATVGGNSQWNKISNHVLHPSAQKSHSSRIDQAIGNNKREASLRHSQPILRNSQRQSRKSPVFIPQKNSRTTGKDVEAGNVQIAQEESASSNQLPALSHHQPSQLQEERPDPSLLQENQDFIPIENTHRVQFEMASPVSDRFNQKNQKM